MASRLLGPAGNAEFFLLGLRGRAVVERTRVNAWVEEAVEEATALSGRRVPS
jgi:hypothetical protein